MREWVGWWLREADVAGILEVGLLGVDVERMKTGVVRREASEGVVA